jgi:hypothetical protein
MVLRQGWLHYLNGDNGSSGNGGRARRFALHDDDVVVAADDALCSWHPNWHAPGELTRDSGNMLLGASLLQGSHCGSNHTGNNGGSRRHALADDNDDDATDDVLCSWHPIWHAPGELTRDSGYMLLGASLLQGSHCGSNHTGSNGGSRRNALADDNDDNATDDDHQSGHPVWHAPGELASNSDCMSLGTSLL